MTMPQTQDSQRLKRQYFAYPETWRFNSPDFYLFYYALGALLSVLLILFLLVLLVSGRPPAETAITQNLPPSPPPASAPIDLASTTPKPAASLAPRVVASAVPSPAASLVPANDALISAEQQPSYALRAESYARLRDDASLSATDRQRATQAYQRYNGLALQAQNRLETALDGIGKDRYTVSIRQLQALIKEGEVLGDVYLQAEQELPKAYYKKIDYYMLKGQISKASRALGEAKAAGIQSETISEYETKIKNLMKVSK